MVKYTTAFPQPGSISPTAASALNERFSNGNASVTGWLPRGKNTSGGLSAVWLCHELVLP